MASKYKTKKESIPSDHNGISINYLKPRCIEGAKANSDNKKRADNPYHFPSQAYRQWDRGFRNHEAVFKFMEPIVESTKQHPEPKKVTRKKKVKAVEESVS